MINLLPDTSRQELKAAHSNTLLLKYIFTLGLGLAFLSFICGGAYFILMDTKASAENVISLNQEKSSSYSTSQNQATTLKTSLAKAKSILDSEVRYSKLLTTIASLMPAGTIIDNLNLNDNLFSSSTSLTIFAKSTTAALKLKDNFQSSSLFSNVTFQSITDSTTVQADGYTVTAVVNLTINKGAVK